MQGTYDITVVTNTTNAGLCDQLGLTVRLVPFPIERGISLRRDVSALIQLIRLFRRERFDVVHSMNPKAGLLAMVAAAIARTPVRVHTFTGQVWVTRRGFSRFVLKQLDRVIAASATIILIDSTSQRDFLLAQGVVRDDNSAVLGHGSVCGVDGHRFRPDRETRDRLRQQLGIGSDDVVLLFAGRLKRDKGVLDLARAFATIADARADVRLLVVGPDEEQLRPLLTAAVGRHVDRLHLVDLTHEPESFMAASDVLCLPSYREGFGSVIIEAAAVGLPAVASRIYGIVDAMQEGRTGLAHPAGDVKAIATTLLRLLADPQLRSRLGTAARQRALRDFSAAAATAAVLGLYDRLTGPAERPTVPLGKILRRTSA
jgi:glycosyltransferase involved in cell wall biosynthesis